MIFQSIKRLKSGIAMFLAMVMVFSTTTITNVSAAEVYVTDALYFNEFHDVVLQTTTPSAIGSIAIAPSVALLIYMTTDADYSEIEAGDEVTVTVRWTSAMIPTNLITIEVINEEIDGISNEAQILINDASNITFTSGGTYRPISNLVIGNDVVTFTSGTQVHGSGFQNELIFRVQAPPSAGSFGLSVMVGIPANPTLGTNIVERTFNVGSGFYIRSSEDVVVGDMPFNIFGQTGRENVSGTDFMVGFNIAHVDDPSTQRLGHADPTASDGSFNFAQLSFPSNAQEGTHIVTALLFDADGDEISAADPIFIEYVKPSPSINLNLSHDRVVGSESFRIYGDIEDDDVFFILGTISRYDDPGNHVYLLDLIMGPFPSNIVEFEFFKNLASQQDGRFIVEVTVLDGVGDEIARAEAEIEFVRYELTPTNPRCELTNLARDYRGAVMSASSSLNAARNAAWTNNGIRYVLPPLPLPHPSWQALTDGPEYLMVDFGEIKEFNRVVIFQNAHRIRNYALEYSIDGAIWYALTQGNNFAQTNSYGISFLDYMHHERVAGQFVRLRIGHSSLATPVSVFEFEVYNMPNMYNVTVSGIDVNTNVVINSPTTQPYIAGRTHQIIAPEIPGYTLIDALVNGVRTNPVGGDRVNVNVIGNMDIVFRYGITRYITVRHVRAGANESLIEDLVVQRAEGSTVQIIASSVEAHVVSGALVNGMGVPLVSGNRVNVTITGNMEVVFEHNVRPPNRIIGVDYAGGSFRGWNQPTNHIGLWRNRELSLIVTGRAMYNNVPVPYARIVVGVYNPSSPINSSNVGYGRRAESSVVITDSDGYFRATFTPFVLTRTHDSRDLGHIYIRNANAAFTNPIWRHAASFQRGVIR
ncbi:MAG: discoidin domain-containing protein [Defluviitaleaceae bacterium]|nr:discoidin domain-containing protein [Defluviitaleaceae bacterium]